MVAFGRREPEEIWGAALTSRIHWRLHRIELGVDRRPVPGKLLAEVECAGGRGELRVFDPDCDELLRELFEEDQTVFVASEPSHPDVDSDAVDFLAPWRPETLAYVRAALPRYRILAVPVADDGTADEDDSGADSAS